MICHSIIAVVAIFSSSQHHADEAKQTNNNNFAHDLSLVLVSHCVISNEIKWTNMADRHFNSFDTMASKWNENDSVCALGRDSSSEAFGLELIWPPVDWIELNELTAAGITERLYNQKEWIQCLEVNKLRCLSPKHTHTRTRMRRVKFVVGIELMRWRRRRRRLTTVMAIAHRAQTTDYRHAKSICLKIVFFGYLFPFGSRILIALTFRIISLLVRSIDFLIKSESSPILVDVRRRRWHSFVSIVTLIDR